MKTYFLLLFLSTVSPFNHRRRYAPSFLRDSVEKITNYPFQKEPVVASARKDDGDFDDYYYYNPQGGKQSHLVDYVFRSFGSRNLPLREAVESLPVPLLTAERRNVVTGRLPLRDAVEHSTINEQINPFNEYMGRSNQFQNYRNPLNNNFRRGRSYNYKINYDPYIQFDPTIHEILPYRISDYQENHMPYSLYNEPLRRGETLLDYDTVEVTHNHTDSFRPFGSFFNGHDSMWLRRNEEKNEVAQFLGNQEHKVVCYLQGWANYRKEPMKFNTANIDPFACTHIIYAFAGIDPHSFTIYPQNEDYDVVQGGYRSVVGLKRFNPRLKVLISIAGWSTGDSKFSTMVSSAVRRQKFIKSVARFLDLYHFDGVDLDWEFPGAEDLGGTRKDKENYSLFLEELAEVFLFKNWLLSAAVASSRFRVEDGYDVRHISRYLDLINVLAFDLHAERDEVADHHSPLYRRQHDQGLDIFYNADYAMQYWIKKGAPREKLILGLPFFARSFTLANPNRWLPGSEVAGLGKEGPFTQNKGFLGYFEVCEMIANGGWRLKTDSVGSPYAVKGNQWVGYDDPRSIQNKVNYVKKQRLGGVALYAIDLDDYQGICGSKWPLLNTVRNALSTSKPINQEIISPPVNQPPKAPVPGTVIVRPEHVNCTGQGYVRDFYDCRLYHRCEWGWKTSYICPDFLHFDESLKLCNWPEVANCPLQTKEDIKGKSAMGDEFKIVCYFTNWAWYRKGDGKFVPEHIDPRLCTHIVYAYASLDPNELKIKPFDTSADIDHNFYDRITKLSDLRKSSKRTSVLLAIGGWTDSTGDKYSRLVSDGTARRNFVTSTVDFLKTYRFQGLHFDWIYPKCWQSDCNRGPESDLRNFAELIQELSDEFKRQSPPLTLAVGISGYREVIDVAYDVAKISRAVDFMSIMTYDYHGAWEKKTGHVSPLYYRPGDSFPRFNTNYTLEYLTVKGADRSKLLMGIPFYGQSFTLKMRNNNNYGAPAEGPGAPGEFTRQPGMLAYYEICDKVLNKQWQVSRDPSQATGPYAFKDNQWVSYDDIESVKQKANYIKDMGYGGAMAWTIDLDDFNNRCCRGPFPLLKALGRALGRISEEEPVGSDCTRPVPPVTPPPPVTTTGVDSGASSEHEHHHTTRPTWTRPTTTVRPTTPMTTTQKPWWETTPKPTTSVPTTTTTTTQRPTMTETPWWERPTTPTPTTTKRPTTTLTTTTEDLENESEVIVGETIENCEPGKYYADPKNCNVFYRCVLGELQKQFCIVGLHWNSQQNICDWPENAKCDKDNYVTTPASTTTERNEWWSTSSQSETTWSTSTTTTTTEAIISEKPDIPEIPISPTSCVNGMYYPVPGNCGLFQICVNDVLITQSCAPGLRWNQQMQICDWSHNVPCEEALNKFHDAITFDLDILSQPCQEGTYANYPGNCNQYLSCMWGTYAVFNCAPGLHWNNLERICDWPHRANCDPGNPTGGEVPVPPEIPEFENENEITGGGIVTQPPTKPPFGMPPTTQAPTIPEMPVTAQSGYFKIVCYFTNWAWYRQGAGKYLPENIDPNLCTHIVYGFAVLDYENLVIKAHDSWADFDNKFYERVVAYKKKGLKVTLAIGGWNDSQGDKYSRLVNNPASRKKFINHVIQFLKKYDFDGLDLDWEYPKCWQVDCNKGPDSDKSAFSAFVRELHDAFKPLGLLLSAAVSPSKTVVDAGYDVPALGEYLDWVSVMTYDYHGQWDKKTGHVAPMYFHEDDEFYFFNANYSINYWISQGVPRRKVIMGMPLYGQSFQLANPSNNGLNANAPGPGQAGEFTRAAGFLAYYEICDRIQNRGWTVVRDEKKRMGPYAYKGNQWVSFDDVETIKMKSNYIRQMDLGGGMIWALDLDDFSNKCGGGKHPLLSTIRSVLGPAPSENEVFPPEGPPAGITSEAPPRPPGQPIVTTPKPVTPKPGTTTEVMGGTTGRPPFAEEFKVVCYFTNWAWYRQGLGKFLPSDIDPNLCTHIIYGFAVLNGDQGIIKPHDPWADFDNKFYEKVTQFKKMGIKVLIAIGGWNDSAGDKYSRLVNNPSARAKFINHVIDFIQKNNFDGLDLDWEYPKCWQVNCKMGPDSDKPAFADFVRELKAAFEPRGLLLSAAVSPSKRVIDAGYDVPTLSKYLDWISVMTYDFHGQWDKRTGHVAPMYLHADDVDVTFHANYSINYWISEGADRKKIVMGLPMYGQSFSLANVQENGLNAPSYGGGEAGEFTRARGFLSYYEICHNIREKNWKVVRDKKGRMGPYAYLRDQWVSFDDQDMIKHKSEYIRYMGLGGGMIWALDLDDFKNRCQCEAYPLLKTINRVLRNYPGPQPVCVLDGKENEIMPQRPGFGETPPPIAPTFEPEPITQFPVDQKPPMTQPPMTQPPMTQPPMTQQPMTTTQHTTEFTMFSTTTTTRMPPVTQPLSCNGQMFVPHPDCNKYYLCIHGKLEEMNCPAGLHWNKNHCDWPRNSGCKSSVSQVDFITTTSRPVTTWSPATTSRPTPPWTTMTTMPSTVWSTTRQTTTETFQPETTTSIVTSPNSEYKVVCYFTNWAWYRPGIGKYTPENIDYELCTHIAYGFAVLDPNTLTIKPHDSWADIDNEFYIKVTNLKKKGLKVLIAIGGWNDSLGNKYSRLVGSPLSRRKFIETVIQFIQKYNFDGLDLDWEYPKCWQVNCDAGPAEDKENFATFVEELSKAFKPKGLLLSSAVSPSKIVIDLGYEVAKLSRFFDYISVMTYDFHGHWDKVTGHVAPLYYYPGDTYDYFNANYSINYWIEKGADRRKIIMGMPLYGQSFQLQNPNEHGLNAPASGPGQAGEFTRAGGFLSFYEICEYVKRQGWKVTRDSMGRIGPYAYKGNQWVSYDDVSEIRRKSQFIKQMGLGGGMIWALDLDDFRNRCGCGNHPLLKTLSQELRGIGGQFSDCT